MQIILKLADALLGVLNQFFLRKQFFLKHMAAGLLFKQRLLAGGDFFIALAHPILLDLHRRLDFLELLIQPAGPQLFVVQIFPQCLDFLSTRRIALLLVGQLFLQLLDPSIQRTHLFVPLFGGEAVFLGGFTHLVLLGLKQPLQPFGASGGPFLLFFQRGAHRLGGLPRFGRPLPFGMHTIQLDLHGLLLAGQPLIAFGTKGVELMHLRGEVLDIRQCLLKGFLVGLGTQPPGFQLSG